MKTLDTSQQQQQQQQASTSFSSGSTSIDRGDFDKLLECLCEDFPKHLQQRTLDVLQQRQVARGSGEVTQQRRGADAVALAEFQRGVEVCLLLEGECGAVGRECAAGVAEVLLFLVLTSSRVRCCRQSSSMSSKISSG